MALERKRSPSNRISVRKKEGNNSSNCWALGSEVQIAYLVELLCPRIKDITILPQKLLTSQQAQIIKKHGKKSLRELARKYGVSHETVRRTIKRV